MASAMTGEEDRSLFVQAEEHDLYSRIAKTIVPALMTPSCMKNSRRRWRIMADLRAPVDAFFDHVTVNCDDPALRHNRLLMLSQIRATLDRVADFSQIEG